MKLAKKGFLGLLIVTGVLMFTACGENQAEDEAALDTSGAQQAMSENPGQNDISQNDQEPEVTGQALEEDEESTTPPRPDPGAHRALAPDFTLTDLGGNTHSLSSYRGKVVLLDFWASWCGPCKVEIPYLITTYKKYRSQGLVVLGVGLDSKHLLNRASADLEITYPVLVDDRRITAQPYGIRGIPRSILVDKKGRMAFDHEGFRPGMEKGIEAEVKKLLAEEY